jgi:hypothetical protein
MDLDALKRRRSTRTKNLTLPYGVYLRDRTTPYIVKFYRKGKSLTGQIYVGSFDTLAEAKAAAFKYLKENP